MMNDWESLIDRKIREAMEDGEFDDLSGKGEPIDLTENPFEDPDWRMAHRMLRQAGFAPAWIEERKDIEAEIAAARNTLARIWMVLQNAHHRKFPFGGSEMAKGSGRFSVEVRRNKPAHPDLESENAGYWFSSECN
jgi:hypothetical protein